MQRLLIISHDVVGRRMAGPGIRAWELAQVLSRYAEVTLLAPQPIDLTTPSVHTAHFSLGNSASLAVHLRRADVILAHGSLLEPHPELADVRQPLILDLYVPTLLENLELFRNAPLTERRSRIIHDTNMLTRQLLAGDMFLCATERQRDLYLGALIAVGRLSPEIIDADPLLRRLISVVPFGLPDTPPVRTGPGIRGLIAGIGATDPIILWTSGLWDWLDPLTLIRAMPQVIARVPDARLVFMSGRRPGGASPMSMPDRARALASELGLLNHSVFFFEMWLPYADYANSLLDATVAVSLHREHLEMTYAAIRSRVLDYLWAGLPSVLSDGDPAAALAREHGFALVTPPEDVDAVAGALITLLTDEAKRHELAANARALAPRYTWTAVAQPIVAFLVSPPATKLRPASQREKTDAAQLAETSQTDRRQTLQAQRNSALQALEATWRLDQLTPPARGVPGKARNFVLDRIVWPLLASLIARQRDHNAAVIRAAYAAAEYQDYLSDDLARIIAAIRLLSRQTRDIAEQIAELHEADQNLRAALRGDPLAAPPRTFPPIEVIDNRDSNGSAQ